MISTASPLAVRARYQILLIVSCWLVGTSSAAAATATDKIRLYYNLSFLGEQGVMDIELYGNESPLHVENFLDYMDDGEYDLSFIHRSKAGSLRFLQGGSFGFPLGENPSLNDLGNNPIIPRDPVVNEFNAANGLTNSPGTLAAARTANVDSATSGWFINSTNNSAGFDPGPYTVFGQVTRGLDLVHAIASLGNSSYLAGGTFESAPFLPSGGLVVIVNAVRIGVVDGDYNLDGTVDAADYSVWLQSLGSLTGQTRSLQADGNADGIVDDADYEVWKDNLGNSMTTGSATQSTEIPEPSTMLIGLLSGGLLSLYRRRVSC